MNEDAGELAGAKVNLALHVLGQRGDGYHDLDSLAVFAGVGDVLRAEPGPKTGVTIGVTGPFAEELTVFTDIEDNLAVKAARALAKGRWAAPPGVNLLLEKHLPVSAGLGGGSADAAAALRLLNRYWRTKLDNGRLIAIAKQLGADVPMCISSMPVRFGGIGDQLQPVRLPSIALVLINPGVAVPTESVFRAYEPGPGTPMPAVPGQFRSVFELVIWLRTTRNDLYETARTIAPVIGRVVRVLRSDPDCLLAGMSGSGPTCFGIFASYDAAQRAVARMRVGRPDWWVVPTRTWAS